jgi:ribosomal protein S12
MGLTRQQKAAQAEKEKLRKSKEMKKARRKSGVTTRRFGVTSKRGAAAVRADGER